MRKIGVALVGCGGIGKIHAASIKDSPYADLKVACDLKATRARAIAEEYGFERYTTSFDEVLKASDVEVVVVAIPPKYHAEISIRALEAGKHVFCEKPMATNLKEAKEMLVKAEKAGVKLGVDYQNRYLPSHSKLKEIVDSGALGELVQVRARVAYPILESLPSDAPMLSWLFNRDVAGGGVLMDIGTHWTDLARWLASRDYVGIYALVGHFDPLIPSEVEDTATILARMEGDVQAIIDVSWAVKASMWLIEIYGTKGTAMANLPQGVLVYDKKKEEWVNVETPPWEEPHAKLLNLFLKSVTEDEEPPVSGEDGYKSLEAVIAAYKSAEKAAEIKLPL